MERAFVQDNIPGFNGSEEAALQQEINILQTVAGGPRGYRLRRIILVNYWLYTGAVTLEIPHGRLFLAGENASGKSTILTAALPICIEGSLRHNRLDTFGEQHKSIEYYVLGSEQSSTPFTHDARTSYIALEFEWCDPHHPPIAPLLQQRWLNGEKESTRFLTIGLGLYGKLDRKERIIAAYFLITDGSRLVEDLSLIEDRRPISQNALKQLLKEHGMVYERQSDYEQQVSHYLFGFKNMAEFHSLIDLLLTLRRPNLSSELKLSDVHAYLSESLPSIPVEVTRRVIDTINEIEDMVRRLKRLKEEYESVRVIHLAQQALFLTGARKSARTYLEVEQKLKEAQTQLGRQQRAQEKARQEEQEAQRNLNTLVEQQNQIQAALRVLDLSETSDRDTSLTTAREQLETAETQERQQSQLVTSTNNFIKVLKDQQGQHERLYNKTRGNILNKLDELARQAERQAFWGAAALQFQANAEQLEPLDLLSATLPALLQQQESALDALTESDHLTWLTTIAQLHQTREHLERDIKMAAEAEKEKRQDFDNALTTFQQQELTFHTGTNSLESSLAALTEAYPLLSLPERTLALDTESFFQISGETFDEHLMQKALEFYQQHFAESSQQIEQASADLARITAEAQRQRDRLQSSHDSYAHQLSQVETLFAQKQQEEEQHPPLAERRLQARQHLRASGIAAHPLYTLIDFSEAISYESGMAGQIEYLLADAGLLDTLVVSPDHMSAALDILVKEGLSDCILTWPDDQPAARTQTPFTDWLRFDPTFSSTREDAWRLLIPDLLTRLARSIAISSPDASSSMIWQYGLLSGHSGQGSANVIGRSTRQARHRQELARLTEQMELLRGEMARLTSQIDSLQEQIHTQQTWQDTLKSLLISSSLQATIQQMPSQIAALKQAWSRYRQAREQTEQRRQERQTLLTHLEKTCQGISDLAHSTMRVSQAIDATKEIITGIRIIRSDYERTRTSYTDYHASGQTLANKQNDLRDESETLQDMQSLTARARATLQQLQQVNQEQSQQDPETRRRHLQEQDRTLNIQIGDVREERGKCEERVNQLNEKIKDASTQVEDQQTKARAQRQALQEALKAYPLPLDIQHLWEQANLIAVARQLLSDFPQEESLARWQERLDDEEQEAQNSLNDIYYKERSTLYVYGPEKSTQDNRVIFLHEENSSPAEMLTLLEDRVQTREALLEQEERKLFEDFLLQHMAQEISEHIHRAQDWVQKLNATLQAMTVVGDRYDLAWQPIAPPDITRPGGHLACHTQLLRKKKQILTPEERELLQEAFQQEIQTLRRLQKSDAGIHFEDLLREIFDYRAWFHFDIAITPQGGKRMLLDNKVLGGRSGAERLFALYIPLFAALSLLYDSASAGAPRLLALDEAFDKASSSNMQRTIEFLVEQQFQWIMTGPQINLSGARIPVSIRYLMLHEKGSKLATVASSRTWQSTDFPLQEKDTYNGA